MKNPYVWDQPFRFPARTSKNDGLQDPTFIQGLQNPTRSTLQGFRGRSQTTYPEETKGRDRWSPLYKLYPSEPS